MRPKIVAGNWKMNKTLEEAHSLTSEIMGMVADEVKGNVIKAFVILRIGHEPGDRLKNELLYHVRITLGPIAMPSEIEFVTSLPKTRSGKIMRRVLKAKEMGMDPGDITTLED